MVTKAIIKAMNMSGNKCTVQIPLFTGASSSSPLEVEALISVTPGFINNFKVNDIVFVAFEENALEKAVIIGKLYRGYQEEAVTRGGTALLDTLIVYSSASLPSSTVFVFPDNEYTDYKNFKTPKKIADYIKWLESHFKNLIQQVDDNFRCLKNWTQFQLQPENVEVDDGDLDLYSYNAILPAGSYQQEGDICKICGAKCTKNKKRNYLALDINKKIKN